MLENLIEELRQQAASDSTLMERLELFLFAVYFDENTDQILNEALEKINAIRKQYEYPTT